jgi:hypothetical protein
LGFPDLRRKKEELYSGESKGKHRYNFSVIPWDIFIAEDGVG